MNRIHVYLYSIRICSVDSPSQKILKFDGEYVYQISGLFEISNNIKLN